MHLDPSMVFDGIFVGIFLVLEVMYYFTFRKFETRVYRQLDEIRLEIQDVRHDHAQVDDRFKGML